MATYSIYADEANKRRDILHNDTQNNSKKLPNVKLDFPAKI
jgi:hypothetical protein